MGTWIDRQIESFAIWLSSFLAKTCYNKYITVDADPPTDLVLAEEEVVYSGD